MKQFLLNQTFNATFGKSLVEMVFWTYIEKRQKLGYGEISFKLATS